MTVVSSKEFATNQSKYFDLAVKEDVRIKRGRNIFYLRYEPVEKINISEQPIFEPDDDLRRAITMDEFKERALVMVEKIHNMYARK